jgi:tRNA threonylcarbamoyladenosine biosynthesis protein TsaE
MNKVSKNTEDTAKIAKEFLSKLEISPKTATVVGLYGDLGSGKTAFTQAVAKLLNIKKKVNSPTFVIMKKYSLPKRADCKNFLASKKGPVLAGENLYNQLAFKYFFHLDAYRLKNEKELFHLGWEEMISNREHLIFIEWPEQVIKAMPKKYHKISIYHTKEGHRKFVIKKA